MPSTRSTLVPVVLMALVACSAGESTAPPEVVLFPSAASYNNGAGVVLKVSGAGVADFTSGGGSLAPFQFVAHKKADGSVKGHFRMFRTSSAPVVTGGPPVFGTVDFEGEVTCLTVDPNLPGRARIGGKVTANNSTHPLSMTAIHQVGQDVWFRVTSSANGADAGDKTTTYGFKGALVDTSDQYCALTFADGPFWSTSIFPLANGQITIHQ